MYSAFNNYHPELFPPPPPLPPGPNGEEVARVSLSPSHFAVVETGKAELESESEESEDDPEFLGALPADAPSLELYWTEDKLKEVVASAFSAGLATHLEDVKFILVEHHQTITKLVDESLAAIKSELMTLVQLQEEGTAALVKALGKDDKGGSVQASIDKLSGNTSDMVNFVSSIQQITVKSSGDHAANKRDFDSGFGGVGRFPFVQNLPLTGKKVVDS
eukprot:Lankesteria_metandrocarpae@DN4389_c0_g1_i1.p1